MKPQMHTDGHRWFEDRGSKIEDCCKGCPPSSIFEFLSVLICVHLWFHFPFSNFKLTPAVMSAAKRLLTSAVKAGQEARAPFAFA
jgi:hypothetical protein